MYYRKTVSYLLYAIVFLLLTNVLAAEINVAMHSGDTLFIGYGTTPTINGIMSAGEWDDALSVVLVETGGTPGDATLYLKHDTNNLFAAFENTNANYWVWWILIDTQNGGGTAPQTDDYKLIGPGYMVENVGDGSQWVQVSPSGWIVAGDEFTSECSIEYGKLGLTSGVAKTVGIGFCYGGAMPWENVWPPGLDAWTEEVIPNAWGDIFSDDNWGSTAVEEKPYSESEIYFQSYPNPFSDVLEIDFSLKRTDQIILQIYDCEGRVVRTLVNAQLTAGRYRIRWDRRNEEGNTVSKGKYFVRLESENNVNVKSAIVIE